MKRWLIMVLVLAVALALATAGVTVAQQTTNLHKHNGGRNQATTQPSSSSSPSQTPELTNDGKLGSSTATNLPESMKSAVQQSGGQSAGPAASSGPVYGPYTHSVADTSTIYRGFAAVSYGFVYPYPTNPNLRINSYYYDPSNQQLVFFGGITPQEYAGTLSGQPVLYYVILYALPTSAPSGTWVLFAGNCQDPLQPSGGCVENYTVVNVA